MTYINDFLPKTDGNPWYKPLTLDQLQRIDAYVRQVNAANADVLDEDSVLFAVASINGGLIDSFSLMDPSRVLREQESFIVQFGGEDDLDDPADVYIPEQVLTPEEEAEEAAWQAGEAARQAEHEAKAVAYDRDHAIQFNPQLTAAAHSLVTDLLREENIPGVDNQAENEGYVDEINFRIRDAYDTQVILAEKATETENGA